MKRSERNLNRLRNRIASLRDMPVLYEFNDHPLQPRFTMERRGELSVSIQEGDQPRQLVGTIIRGKFYPNSYVTGAVPTEPGSLIREKETRDELLALGQSIYQTLLTKFDGKQR